MPEDASARVTSLSLRDFRNFAQLECEFPPSGVVLVGENGQGKTNLLEAACYCSLLRSVRGARDADVVRFGAAGFFMEAAICAPDAHSVAVGFDRGGKRKRVRLDGVVVDRISDALGALPAVMFSPADVEIVAGGPVARRRFLDIMLALNSRTYLQALQQYRAALDRRNAALRESVRRGHRDAAPIAAWEPALAEYGAVLLRSRATWTRQAASDFTERCARMGEAGIMEMRYQSDVDTSAESVELALLEALEAKRGTDMRAGVTQAGPHRDDVAMLLDGRDLRVFGSAGQHRTAAIALRTLEAETLLRTREARPVFLLDDPFAELDERRAERVLSILNEIDLGGGQVLLAVPRASDIPTQLTNLPRWHVSAGTIAQ